MKELAEQWYKPRINDLIASSCEGGEKCPRNQSDYIIAIVPDPVHTHLALQFDRAIEAIEEAMQDRGFVFAHAILPWESKTHPETDDYENRLEAEWFTAAREDFPGLMVFRGDSKHPGERRFVWVVAETPTGGIQTSQFQKAAAWIPWPPNAETGSSKKWRTGKSTDPVLRILGPTYSGSLFSLTQLLTCSSAAGRPCQPLPGPPRSPRAAVIWAVSRIYYSARWPTGPRRIAWIRRPGPRRADRGGGAGGGRGCRPFPGRRGAGLPGPGRGSQNVEEALAPAILEKLPEAGRVRYLRCLAAQQDEQYWRQLWRQSCKPGRVLVDKLAGRGRIAAMHRAAAGPGGRCLRPTWHLRRVAWHCTG